MCTTNTEKAKSFDKNSSDISDELSNTSNKSDQSFNDESKAQEIISNKLSDIDILFTRSSSRNDILRGSDSNWCSFASELQAYLYRCVRGATATAYRLLQSKKTAEIFQHYAMLYKAAAQDVSANRNTEVLPIHCHRIVHPMSRCNPEKWFKPTQGSDYWHSQASNIVGYFRLCADYATAAAKSARRAGAPCDIHEINAEIMNDIANGATSLWESCLNSYPPSKNTVNGRQVRCYSFLAAQTSRLTNSNRIHVLEFARFML